MEQIVSCYPSVSANQVKIVKRTNREGVMARSSMSGLGRLTVADLSQIIKSLIRSRSLGWRTIGDEALTPKDLLCGSNATEWEWEWGMMACMHILSVCYYIR